MIPREGAHNDVVTGRQSEVDRSSKQSAGSAVVDVLETGLELKPRIIHSRSSKLSKSSGIFHLLGEGLSHSR
jgi:hypothetical protein